MPDTQKVVQEKSVNNPAPGKEVVSEKVQVSSSEAEKKKTVTVVTSFIFYVVGVIDVLLAFRFILKMLGANPATWFVAFIYGSSGFLNAPFRGIFPTATTQGIDTTATVEPATIVAFFVYLVVAVGIVQLIKLLTSTNEEE